MRRLINWLGADGLAHVVLSIVICQVFCVVMPLWAAATATFFVGAAKELIWDSFLNKGALQWKDLAADAIGLVLGLLLALLLICALPPVHDFMNIH